MEPLRLIETTPGKYSLLLNAGTTAVDDLVQELGHEPNGYFWEGVTRRLLDGQVSGLSERFEADPEGDTFCAYSTDRSALAELAELLRPLTTDADLMRAFITAADADGFDFDD